MQRRARGCTPTGSRACSRQAIRATPPRISAWIFDLSRSPRMRPQLGSPHTTLRTAAPERSAGVRLRYATTSQLVRRGDLAPEFVEGYAVEEGGRLDHQPLAEPHEPRVGVLIRLAVESCAFPVPQYDHVVPVGVDPANVSRFKRPRLREPSAEGS